MWQKFRASKLIGFLGLFSSFGTLLCCAIPSLLVLLGFGAALANFLGEFPQLIWPSENKEWVFSVSFLMLTLSWLAQRYSSTQVCPIDQQENCQQAKNWSRPIFFITFGINIFGAFYAFILPKLM
jgi:mercuric ion transport protein